VPRFQADVITSDGDCPGATNPSGMPTPAWGRRACRNFRGDARLGGRRRYRRRRAGL